MRAITDRPELALFVRTVSMHREEYGFHDRIRLGACNWSQKTGTRCSQSPVSQIEVFEAMRSGVPITRKRMRFAEAVDSRDPTDFALNVSETILGLLSRLEHLDCSRYITDAPWSGILESLSSLPKKLEGHFSNLTQLALRGGGRINRLSSVFSLPKLKKLCLEEAHLEHEPSQIELERWKTLQTSGIEEFQIHSLDLRWWHYSDLSEANVLYAISNILAQLTSLSITTKVCGDDRRVLCAFKDRMARLRHLKIHSANGFTKTHQYRQSDPQDAAVWRAIRSSHQLRSLHLGCGNLVEHMSLADFKLAHADTPFGHGRNVGRL